MDDVEVSFLPYTHDYDMSMYMANSKKRIIFSHNDIKGINYGKYISTSGFDIEDINKSCDLFINGHLHNGENVTDKIINIGNLSGQNFSEDGLKYKHNIMIIDTNSLEYQKIENPFATYFIKYDFKKYETSLL